MEISLVELEQLARKLNTQESVKRDSREDDHFVKYFEALKSSLDAALKENADLKGILKSPVPCRDCARVKELECIIKNGKAANEKQYHRICKLESDVALYKERHKNKDFHEENEKLHAENRRLEEENTRLHGALSSVIESFHFVCYECSSDITVDNSAQHKNGNLVCKECAGK